MAPRKERATLRKRLSSIRLLRETYRQAKWIPNRVSDLHHSRPRRRLSTEHSSVLVALTSYPAPTRTVHRTVESLRRQSVTPSRIVLVLSVDEFPDRRLPAGLVRLQEMDLEVIWTTGNLRSYKKLIPVRAKYPYETIVTVDDDVIYRRDFLRDLVEASSLHPGAIIGHRGWEISTDETVSLLTYWSFPPATPASPADLTLLTGVGGIVYPPGSLPECLLQNTERARELCPTADDIWFWALARVGGTTTICLGSEPEPFRVIEALRDKEALGQANVLEGRNDAQLQEAMDYFGLRTRILEAAAARRAELDSPGPDPDAGNRR